MKNCYLDLIDQSFEFPQSGFEVVDDKLLYHSINLADLVAEHGSPLKVSYLPNISKQIEKSRLWFASAMKKHNYKGEYRYAYCTKSSHFSFVLEEVLKVNAQLETSSAIDIDLVRKLYEQGKLSKDIWIICNGFKTEEYIQKASALINEGFVNLVPVLDNAEEIDVWDKYVKESCTIGIRVAAEEGPDFEFYTSRLGLRYKDVVPFYEQRLKNHPKFNLKKLHFFINTGIRDTSYYWNELRKTLNVYCDLKAVCDDLDSLNIGGGFPVQTSLAFDYDYQSIVDEIVELIKENCALRNTPEPNLFTEFGSFTVGESGMTIFSVMAQKMQNDRELWYMIDGSLLTTMPDIFALSQRFLLLPLNHWNKPYQRVNIGGISCDAHDYYNAEVHEADVYLPELDTSEPLHIGFFNTGAYQDALSGYGGIKHCLIPAPKHILINDVDGKREVKVFAEAQNDQSMLNLLGYSAE